MMKQLNVNVDIQKHDYYEIKKPSYQFDNYRLTSNTLDNDKIVYLNNIGVSGDFIYLNNETFQQFPNNQHWNFVQQSKPALTTLKQFNSFVSDPFIFLHDLFDLYFVHGL